MKALTVATCLHADLHQAPPGHPESAERLNLARDALSRDQSLESLKFESSTADRLVSVHDRAMVDRVFQLAEQGGGSIDFDTYVTARSTDAALAMVGATLAAVDVVLDTDTRLAYVLGRPPGHHAESRRPMGFCLFNNVAIAAQYAISERGLDRVAIVDPDIHHGNGTQEIFYDRSDVLYVSTHQYPFYPGTGALSETGDGIGEGYTRNYPLSAGTGDSELMAVVKDEVVPALDEFRPQLLLVSAGYDGHRLDPLGGFNLTGAAFEFAGRELAAVAERHAGGRLVALQEGGYSDEGNREALTSFVKGLITA